MSRILEKLKGGLMRAVAASFVLQVSSIGLSYLLTVVLARLLGVAEYGRYSFVLSLVTLLTLPAQFGLPALLMREVGKARAEGAIDRIHDMRSWAYRLTLLISLPTAIAMLLVLLLAPQLFGSAERWTALWGLALIVFLPLSAIRSGIVRGMNRVIAGQLPTQIIRPGITLFVVVILALSSWAGYSSLRVSAQTAMIANVIGVLLGWIFGAAVLGRILGRDTGARGRKRSTIPGWKSSVLAFGFAGGMYMIDGQIGTLVLGFTSSDIQVGLFKIATQGGLFIAMGYVAANMVLGPRIAHAWARTQKAEVQSLVIRGARLSVLFALPLSVLIFCAGHQIVTLIFGADYQAAVIPLMILVFGQLINCAFGSSTSLLNMTHHERENTVAFGIGLVLSVVLTVALTPRFGAAGAAFAGSSSIVVRNIILWRAAHRLLGIETGCWGRLPKGAKNVVAPSSDEPAQDASGDIAPY